MIESLPESITFLIVVIVALLFSFMSYLMDKPRKDDPDPMEIYLQELRDGSPDVYESLIKEDEE